MPKASATVTRLTRRTDDDVITDMDRYRELTKREAKIKAEKDTLSARLCADGDFADDDWQMTICKNPGRETIVKELLAAQGVSPKVIKKATKTSDPYRYPRITNKAESAKKSADRKAAKDQGEGDARGRRRA